jgi:hypothetical protein
LKKLVIPTSSPLSIVLKYLQRTGPGSADVEFLEDIWGYLLKSCTLLSRNGI